MTRVRLYAERGGDTPIYDGPAGLELMEFLDANGPAWAIIDRPGLRWSGCVHVARGRYEGRWMEFNEHRDLDLVEHIVVPDNPLLIRENLI